MSFIISWSGFFIRKGWDPKEWSAAKNVDSYEKCVKLISKMCVTPPTELEYNDYFYVKPQISKKVEEKALVQKDEKVLKQRPKKVVQEKSPAKPKAKPKPRTNVSKAKVARTTDNSTKSRKTKDAT
ncbi:hypothetical protein OAA09_00490 [bacterium]|nr:hypothetical protein [bacterium]